MMVFDDDQTSSRFQKCAKVQTWHLIIRDKRSHFLHVIILASVERKKDDFSQVFFPLLHPLRHNFFVTLQIFVYKVATLDRNQTSSTLVRMRNFPRIYMVFVASQFWTFTIVFILDHIWVFFRPFPNAILTLFEPILNPFWTLFGP